MLKGRVSVLRSLHSRLPSECVCQKNLDFGGESLRACVVMCHKCIILARFCFVARIVAIVFVLSVLLYERFCVADSAWFRNKVFTLQILRFHRLLSSKLPWNRVGMLFVGLIAVVSNWLPSGKIGVFVFLCACCCLFFFSETWYFSETCRQSAWITIVWLEFDGQNLVGRSMIVMLLLGLFIFYCWRFVLAFRSFGRYAGGRVGFDWLIDFDWLKFRSSHRHGQPGHDWELQIVLFEHDQTDKSRQYNL